MSNKLLYLISFVLVLSLVGFAQAETIPVPDAGFDDSPLSAGGYAYIGEGAWAGEFDYPGPWLSSGGDAWLDNGYYLATGDDTDLPALSGTNKLYGQDSTEDYVYQILDATFEEGAIYTLSISVGQPWEDYDNGWWLYFTGENFEDNLAEASGNAALAWEQVSLVYTATAADAGNKIGIKMKGNQYVSFEDVTLSYVKVITIPVPDAGFDDSPLSAGGYAYIGEGAWAGEFDYPGPWLSSGGDAWLDNGYYLAAGDDTDLPALSGTNKLYARDDTEDYTYQILDATFVEGATYTLSISVGQPWEGYDNGWWLYFTGENFEDNLAEASGNAALAWEQVSLVYTATAADAGNKIGIKMKGDQYVSFEDVTLTCVGGAAPGITIPVDPTSDLAAANAMAQPGDTVEFAAGTYVLTSQIDVKSGVTYLGAGSELTILDGDNLTRAFAAWGDPSATNGQIDENGDGVPNTTGPTGWVLDGLTIQNCVADAANPQDILSAARDLLTNDTGVPYTLEAAQAESGGMANNPDWFAVLSGSADDDLTNTELQTFLDAVPAGSASHLITNKGMNTGGGALILRNDAAGTVQNCRFLNNQAPLNSGDGGAINMSGSEVTLIIDNCEFIGNSCDDGGGAVRVNSASTCTITGSTFTENQAIVNSGDGGAIMVANAGTTLTIDNCEFNRNVCIDGGGAIRLGATGATQTITGSTFTGNTIIESKGDGGAIKVDGDGSTYVLTNCSFIGNTAADDGGAVRYNPDRAEMTVTNCAFIGNGKDADGNTVGDDGAAWHTGDDDAGVLTFANCLFADNASTDDRIIEVKAVFSFLNCTFIGNVAGDEALIGVRGRDWDSTGDENDDATTDDSIIDNCLFINNTLLSNKEIIGDTRNDVFAPTVTNCLFFGNLDQNGDPAINADGNSQEVGTIDVSALTDAAQLVVDPAGDYHLATGSAAIDAANPATATATDIEGTPAQGVRDVGAYEYVGQ